MGSNEGSRLTILSQGIPPLMDASKIYEPEKIKDLLLERGVLVTLSGSSSFGIKVGLNMPTLAYDPRYNGPNGLAINWQLSLLPIYTPVFTDSQLLNRNRTKIDARIQGLILMMFEGMKIGPEQVFGYSSGRLDLAKGAMVDSGKYPIDYYYWQEVVQGIQSGIFTYVVAESKATAYMIGQDDRTTLERGSLHFTTNKPQERLYR
ncbi:hypothetical protein A3C98_05420 [Candidatus Roizmanbacteria bacterium RIFCSPHIGHO2_02_FULL_37_15]|uniref:Uncharacterized protein n=1 Tax=Candidatus Roizmanbacteria bacterium RIFCSPLOWO2_01_FULL_37_16 TaxID=1802058 RepID=A0A1F7IM58_9BACT|nr:MAG: hypothetical protein A2859_04075 [Candidatus Roizmanbacteria bacterium RIFCSPHIGHO2_01_FULL_37_16b]OGK22369.1 MAG: hypothetical protein A3C98_05420 [Candidatus Roizmanbacteria bacterium RIFCSPHIGHO2_02_FULL_37_15]OGK33210.1 MAG: hypothetical protein A3F57_05080 [Candidatus Roizmanbacteria bacterium RIFCSPHIGHO2_12_FULL_36_11]OGK44380.1 MAG: hypothetical protein A3B40_04655 [Candidatus Roizmanbacteria bacterium RIFCSPLOWO2_01_FULL_37_16]OGK57633.1 MAG: hypothetical protein A3I50_00530 [C